MSLQRIPHDTTKYRNNPVELLDISKRSRIGSEYALTANTKLLVTGTGENNSTTILDSTGKTVTRNGDTKISTAQSIIGRSSIYFDGTGDYLSLDASSDWSLSTNDFTIDAWINVPNVTGAKTIFDIRENHGSYIQFYLLADKLVTNGGATIRGGISIPINTWIHVALVVISGTAKIYVNGVYDTQAVASTIGGASYVATVGSYRTSTETTGEQFTGYISHLRITKGQALWTSNFTPPKLISDNYIGA